MAEDELSKMQLQVKKNFIIRYYIYIYIYKYIHIKSFESFYKSYSLNKVKNSIKIIGNELFLVQSEIIWCVQQLQEKIDSGKLSEKKIAETKKYIKTLKNPQAQLVKIRQIMRTNFGDYRAKMTEEEKASKLDLNKVKIVEVKAPSTTTKSAENKFSFVKKSASKAGAKDDDAPKSEFKFSFNVEN